MLKKEVRALYIFSNGLLLEVHTIVPQYIYNVHIMEIICNDKNSEYLKKGHTLNIRVYST